MPRSRKKTGQHARNPKKGTWPVTKLSNGLVNLDKTPPWTKVIAQRNAKDSPLLRLPGEVRNRIFQYALTGQTVEIRFNDSASTYDPETDVYTKMSFKGRATGPKPPSTPLEVYKANDRKAPRVPSAFHLPEVCRQIYSETATLTYSGCVFQLQAENMEASEFFGHWVGSLLPAQKEVVADVALSEMFMESYLFADPMSFRKGLAGLERVHLRDCDLDVLRFMCTECHDELSEEVVTAEDFKAWIRERVAEMEGDGVEVVFYPPLPTTEVWYDDTDESLDEDEGVEGDE